MAFILAITNVSTIAYSQSVKIAGDNGLLSNGCPEIMKIPSTCGTAIISSLASSENINTDFGILNSTGVLVGTNLTSTHTGPAKNGSVTISDGGKLRSAYVYIGYEKNTEGVVTISGKKSLWESYSAGLIGHFGKGTLNILGGGQYIQVNTDYFYISYGEGSQGKVTVSGVDDAGQRSSLITRNRGYVGSGGHGELNILDGGLVSFEYTSSFAEKVNSSAIVNIDGVNAQFGHRSQLRVLNNQMWVGWEGKSIFTVSNGGLLETQRGIHLGGTNQGVGIVTIDGVNAQSGHRSTSMSDYMYVGIGGLEGRLSVSRGGLVETRISFENGSVVPNSGVIVIGGTSSVTSTYGIAHIDGVYGNFQSTMKAAGILYVGNTAKGDLIISNGGLATAGDALIVGSRVGSVGNIVVDGSSGSYKSVLNVNGARIGFNGEGTVTVSNGGELYAGNRGIQIANNPTAKGTLNIGVGGKAGMIYASTIRGMSENATVNLNHADNFILTPALKGQLAVNHINSGTTTFLSTDNDYRGITAVDKGVLSAGNINSFSANSDHIVNSAGTLNLNNFDQTVLSINNKGHIDFGNQVVGTTLTVLNDYTGANGVISISTSLGNDTSPTDKLIVAGTVTGTTQVKVSNLGGTGDYTGNGIQLIQTGESEAIRTFYIAGDYVSAGAYDYTLNLYKNDNGTDNWYLESKLKQVAPNPGNPIPTNPIPTNPQPVYSPNVGSYIANAVISNNLFNSRLEDREGATHYKLSENTDNSLWVRMSAGHLRFTSMSGQLKTDGNTFLTQVGLGLNNVGGNRQFNIGIMGGYGTYYDGYTTSNMTSRKSSSDVHGYSVGLYGSWFENPQSRQGMYVDTWVLWNHFKNKVKTADYRDRSYNSSGLTASVEVGKDFMVSELSKGSLWIQPQFQFTYQHVKAKSFRDDQGVRIDSGKANLQLRLGIKTYLDMASAEDRNYRPYLAFNWIHNTKAQGVKINNLEYSAQGEKNLAEVKIGFEGQLTKNAQVWVNASYQVGKHSNRGYKGNIGWKYIF